MIEAVTVDYPSFIKLNHKRSTINTLSNMELPFLHGKNTNQFPNLEKILSENRYYSKTLSSLNECHNRIERLNLIRSLLNSEDEKRPLKDISS